MDTLPVTPSKILVSACLLGEPVRYDGRAQPLQDALLAQWRREGRVIPCCPELAGGLPVPRAPAERQADGRIVTRGGQDVSAAFARGAACALALCRQHGIRLALLKARSPSCGNREIYDGHFRGQRIAGVGVTAALLRQQGIDVYSELELAALAARVAELDARG